MRTLFRTEDQADQTIVAGFYNGYHKAETTIMFRSAFLQHGRPGEPVSFMPIVDHPERRVVLKPGELAKTRSQHPDPKKQFLNSLVLMLGTPYGVVVLHGREHEYEISKKGLVTGPLPQLHSTGSFTKAAMRIHQRRGIKFLGTPSLLAWLFSSTFEQDLLDQVALDQAAGLPVNDGLPQRIRSQATVRSVPSTQPKLTSHDVKGKDKLSTRPAKTKAEAATAPANKPDPKLGRHPLDILPCRANGFKGKRYADQTPAEKAAGKAMLAKPEEVLEGYPA